jgi:hypothetical protein
MSYRSTVERMAEEGRVAEGGLRPRSFYEGMDQGSGKHAGEGVRVSERVAAPPPAATPVLPTAASLALDQPEPIPAGPQICSWDAMNAALRRTALT